MGKTTRKTAEREWTLMFYFASDNPLAPAIVSQLKALKNAGYHHQANVLAYFDPETVETPTHILDVNFIDKLKTSEDKNRVGFDPNDPFVRNLMLDKLWADETDRDGKPIRNEIERLFLHRRGITLDRHKAPPLDDGDANQAEDAPAKGRGHKPDARHQPTGPQRSLETFLNFCADNYPARHYMLFILGHGQVVGDDVFLFDEHAASHSLTLRGLGKLLKSFKRRKNVRNAEFELVSFHSCSMSSLEIASELEGTANFLLASQGTAYVGSWPYLSILIKIFNGIKRKAQANVKEMITKIFSFVQHNSTDFILAGYSFDLCLCELRGARITPAQDAIKALVTEMKKGLTDTDHPLVKNCILLAHWKSQSFWQENYTDLYDFCFCLDQYCTEFGVEMGNLKAIKEAAGTVMNALMPEDRKHPHQLVILAHFVGPNDQYSHGLSVFFPWAEPSHDRAIMKEYEHYVFQKKSRWLDFLNAYFKGTIRKSRRAEAAELIDPRVPMPSEKDEDRLLEDMAAFMFGVGGGIGHGALEKTGPRDPLGQTGPRDPLGQFGPRDPMGGDCSCGSIKNFPHDTRPREDRLKGGPKRQDDGPTLFNF